MGTTQVIPPGASTLGRIEGAWEDLNRTQRRWAIALAVGAGWACWMVGRAVSANEMAAVTAVAVCTGCAALVDAATERIPNRLLAIAATAVAAVVVLGVAGEVIAPHAAQHSAPTTEVLLGMLGAAVPMLIVRLQRSPGMGGLGMGDVKLAAVLGAAGGLFDPRVGVATVFLAALGASTYGALARRQRTALGPWLFTAWLVALAVAAEVAS